jgi:hypothetical protein
MERRVVFGAVEEFLMNLQVSFEAIGLPVRAEICPESGEEFFAVWESHLAAQGDMDVALPWEGTGH